MDCPKCGNGMLYDDYNHRCRKCFIKIPIQRTLKDFGTNISETKGNRCYKCGGRLRFNHFDRTLDCFGSCRTKHKIGLKRWKNEKV